ncbi:hypothetical protein KFE25_001660 [Diacronema lutheri]|uniref:Uncharacterized protein n=1 Tax=Diacronema lutheri TaxID=2081491 RepID=A0A8J5XK57_DIALT|nr:hypothetical protein KFE25_001660 [Diacronema lutheri]
MAPAAEDVELIKLRGREITLGCRVVVWYEQEDGEVKYHGTVTRLSGALGMRVWFDGHSYTEQEWVNQDDEWRFEDDPASAPADAVAPAQVPDSEDEEESCEFRSIRVKLGKLTQVLPAPGKQGKRKRGSAEASTAGADKDGADATDGAGSKTSGGACATAGPRTTYHLAVAGIFASEHEAVAGESQMAHLRAPRRAPPSLLAKYGRCELSGAVAIFRDPLTAKRYGSAGAFRALRVAHAEAQAQQGVTAPPSKPGGVAGGRSVRVANR